MSSLLQEVEYYGPHFADCEPGPEDLAPSEFDVCAEPADGSCDENERFREAG